MRDVALTDVCDFQGGTQPPKSEWSNTEQPGYIRMLQIRDFTQSNEKYIEYVRNKSSLKTCIEKDILIGRYGASIGKILTGLSGAYNVAMVKTIPNPQVLDTKFLLHLLKSSSFQNFILNIGSRAAQAGFNKKDLTKFRFRLPILAEQKQIAAILDEADNLRQKDQQLVEHYTALRQSLFLEMFGNPISNPRGWDRSCMGSIGKWQSGGTPNRKNTDYFTGDIPWVTSGELNNMYISDSKEHISEDALKNSAAKIINKGSLLLGMYDTAALKSSITTEAVSCNQAIAFSKLDSSKANTVFIYSMIQYGKEHFRRLQRGVRQKNLNLTMIKEIEIIHPPIELQNQFAKHVAIIEKQKQQAQANLQKSEALFNSLLQRAFTGELTANKAA